MIAIFCWPFHHHLPFEGFIASRFLTLKKMAGYTSVIAPSAVQVQGQVNQLFLLAERRRGDVIW
jgi:hypothetical protein